MHLNSKTKKNIGYLVAILIGAMSNGLWEKVFEPILGILGKGFIWIMSTIFSSYIDSIYRNASNGFHEHPSLMIFVLINLIVILAYQKLVFKHPESKRTQTKVDIFFINFIRSRRGYYTTYFISLASITFLFTSVIQIIYINKIVTYSEKSMNIVSVYIDEHERLMLKSEFASMNNVTDFKNFNQHLNRIAEKNDLGLPKIDIF